MLDVLKNEVYKRISDYLWAGWDESKAENTIDCTGKVTDAQLQQWREDQEQLERDTMREVINDQYPAARENPVIHTFFEEYWKEKRRYEFDVTNQGFQIMELENRLRNSAQTNRGLTMQIKGLQYQIAGLQSVGNADTIEPFPAMPGAYLDNITGQAFSISPDGGIENMARLKANIGGKWITGENAQQLVNNVLADSQKAQKSGQTVKGLCENYMSVYKGKGAIEENTLNGYKGYLKNHIYGEMGDKDITEITPDVVQSYINVKAGILTKKTIKEHISLMAEIFESVVEDGKIARNPFKSKRLKIFGKASTVVKAYEEEEFSQFEKNVLPNLEGSTKLYAAISLYTGMRKGEICALRWEEIDFTNKRLHVDKTIIWPSQNRGKVKEKPKTKNGERDMVIMPQLSFILNANKQKSGYLIHGERAKEDEPITNQGHKRLMERIAIAIQESGIDFDFRSLNRRGRHTFATLMNNAGLDDKTIEDQMGHYSADFTRKRYSNSQNKQVERGMEKLSSYMDQMAQM